MVVVNAEVEVVVAVLMESITTVKNGVTTLVPIGPWVVVYM